MTYVSVRYGGFNLSANNEINGLTLGGVGRETDLDFIEVVNNKDDGVEFFGGAAQIKHLISANGGDDGLDFDEGWRGKVQFVFVLQGTPGADKSDKGFEQDGGTVADASLPFAIPTMYNMTVVGLGQKATYTDRLKNTAMHFRDNAGGRHFNSTYLDFGGAAAMIEGGSAACDAAGSSGQRSLTAYAVDAAYQLGPAGDNQLDVQDNVFYCVGAPAADRVPTGKCSIGGNACCSTAQCVGGWRRHLRRPGSDLRRRRGQDPPRQRPVLDRRQRQHLRRLRWIAPDHDTHARRRRRSRPSPIRLRPSIPGRCWAARWRRPTGPHPTTGSSRTRTTRAPSPPARTGPRSGRRSTASAISRIARTASAPLPTRSPRSCSSTRPTSSGQSS